MIDHGCGLYANERGRCFYGPVTVLGRPEIDIGDVLTTTYPRWGLSEGTNLLVVRVRPLLLAGSQQITLWGLGPEL
jgi:hypothetical protein